MQCRGNRIDTHEFISHVELVALVSLRSREPQAAHRGLRKGNPKELSHIGPVVRRMALDGTVGCLDLKLGRRSRSADGEQELRSECKVSRACEQHFRSGCCWYAGMVEMVVEMDLAMKERGKTKVWMSVAPAGYGERQRSQMRACVGAMIVDM